MKEVLRTYSRIWGVSIVGVLLSFLLIPSVSLALEVGGADIGAYIKNTTRWNLHDPNEMMQMETTFQVELDKQFGEHVHFYAKGRYFYDLVFHLEDSGLGGMSGVASELTNTEDLRYQDYLREVFLDITLDKYSFRLGKQQLVWGKVDGLRLLDIINPMDYRQGPTILDWEDVRIPLWMVVGEYYPTYESSIQVVWIPFKAEYHNLPPAFTPWSFRATDNVAAIGRMFRIEYHPKLWRSHKPAHTFENSEYGLRWKHQWGNLGYTLNWFYTWDDIPHAKPGSFQIFPRPGVFGRYDISLDRMNIFGGSFDYFFANFLGVKEVLSRGEIVFNRNQMLYRDDPVNFIKEKDTLNFVLGLEKVFYRKYSISVQLIQNWILDYKKSDRISGAGGDLADEVETSISLNIMTQWFYNRVKPSLLVIYSEEGDGWVKPNITFELTSNAFCSIGANLFWGNRDDFWGEFVKNNQVLFEVRYGF